MRTICDVVGETGLHFYGKIGASMSHEINNALAIIQEHTGLLDDFTAMAKEGVPMDPQRVKSLAEKIQGQIVRANGIVKRLNFLAHSADESQKDVDISETMSSMLLYTQRLAAVRGVTLEFNPMEQPLTIHTSPFFLQNLLWLFLDFSIDAAGPEKTVVISAQQSDQGVAFTFSRLKGLDTTERSDFPGKSELALLDALKATWEMDAHAGEIVLTIPKKI